MTVGSTAYRHTLHHWRRLHDRPRTFAEQVEYEALGRLLDKAEATHGCLIRDIVDDYSFAVGDAGNLSGAEL